MRLTRSKVHSHLRPKGCTRVQESPPKERKERKKALLRKVLPVETLSPCSWTLVGFLGLDHFSGKQQVWLFLDSPLRNQTVHSGTTESFVNILVEPNAGLWVRNGLVSNQHLTVPPAQAADISKVAFVFHVSPVLCLFCAFVYFVKDFCGAPPPKKNNNTGFGIPNSWNYACPGQANSQIDSDPFDSDAQCRLTTWPTQVRNVGG